MLLQKSSKKISSSEQMKGGNRLLITVTVLGSAGPLRFLVNEKELVATVINTALRSYAREGRLPVLSSDLNSFLLYCANSGFEPMSPLEPIGSLGGRNFVLCEKQRMRPEEITRSEGRVISVPSSHRKGGFRKGGFGGGSWKAWFNKSLMFKITSH